MDEFEIAYYLDRRQLLLLLSLIDQRPVAGLPPVEEPEDWRTVSLSLLEDGRLRCEDGRLVMEEELGGLLLDMKDAGQVWAVYDRRSWGRVLYQGGRTALLELLPGGKDRLRRAGEGELRQLLEDALTPSSPMPDALLVSLPEDRLLLDCLAGWESISPAEGPEHWLALEKVRAVVERRGTEGLTRWIRIEDDAASLLLRQDGGGIRAELDTASRRRRLPEELGWEA